jgi:transposase
VLSQDIPDRCRASSRTVVQPAVVSNARLVITAVVLEGRSPSEVAKTYEVSRSWIYELVARYRCR